MISADGQPLSGVHVEIDDAGTAIPVTSTYTQSDGTFELYNIPQGNYEVIAASVNSEASDPISLDSQRPRLELQLPAGNSAPGPLDATTSVARMMVPKHAIQVDPSEAAAMLAKLDSTETEGIVTQR